MSRILTSPARQRKPRAPDTTWLRSFRHRACECCGVQGQDNVVAAHVRAGEGGKSAGVGYKPPDALTVALCHSCHAEQEANPGPKWWFENVFKNMLRRRYGKWLEEKDVA